MKKLLKISYIIAFTVCLISTLAFSCEGNTAITDHKITSEEENTDKKSTEIRIVSLSGTLTEILCELGLTENIVATDVTSSFPEKMANLPKVGHNRNVSLEGILSQSPTHVLALKEACNLGVMDQIKATNVKTEVLPFDYSVDGMTALIKTVSEQFNINYNSDSLKEVVSSQISSIKPFIEKPTVLFIYARGTGTLNVAGKGTKVQKMIELAGAKNVDLDFENFKPLTAEALIKANPDVILLFDSGYESLESGKQLLEVPGVASTEAGRNNAFITMNGSFLSSFSPRMGDAVIELNTKIHEKL